MVRCLTNALPTVEVALFNPSLPYCGRNLRLKRRLSLLSHSTRHRIV